MTKDQALKLALEALQHEADTGNDDAYKLERDAIKEALAQPEHGWTPERIAGMARLKEAQDKKLAQLEPVKIAHKHEWFRTGEMKVGQMRCISCGTWGQEEIPQRTWVGLTDGEIEVIEALKAPPVHPDFIDCDDWMDFARAIEFKLKEKNELR